jgi:peptidoglycan/xylan/chitin deacetylase (PgdA/CDA1 family)
MQHSAPPYQILLSFDLEEFDIPLEYGARISQEQQLNITRQGMQLLVPLLQQLQLGATFFTTAFYALQNKASMVELAVNHEIASHCFYHGSFAPADIVASRRVLQEITGQPVDGFRMPRLAVVDKSLLREAGYLYDASLNPTWLPGRYNYLQKPRTLFYADDIWTMPASVTPLLRIPLFWLAFKNLPLWFIKQCSLRVLQRDGYLNLYYHPWEYADLIVYSLLPFYTRKPCGLQLLDKLSDYLTWLKSQGQFTTTGSYIKQRIANAGCI